MGNVPATQVEERIRSAFPEGAVERVQVLAHGDDPEVGPGETAVRVFLSRGGRPEGPQAGTEILRTFRDSGQEPLGRLSDELRFFEWVEFRPHVQDEPASLAVPLESCPPSGWTANQARPPRRMNRRSSSRP